MARHHYYYYPALVMLLALLAAACTNLPDDYEKSNSSALHDTTSTTLGKSVARVAAQHPGESGFVLLRYGRDAFNLRVALSDVAEKTLDVQVYIWEADETGRIFAERLLRAANRGVRVRILVDDLGLRTSDNIVSAMDAHPNMEVRIFNPFANRSSNLFEFIFDLGRVNHRMHNKIFIVDNSAAIVGGRNIGDHYFGVNQDTNFRDLDIGAIGPIVPEISNVFDYFWQGEWSYPIEALVATPPTAEEVSRLHERFQVDIEAGSYPYDIEQDQAELLRDIADTSGEFIWAKGEIVWDDPAPQEKLDDPNDRNRIATNLQEKVVSLRQSLDIESAYFVLGDSSIELIQNLIDKGIRVRILTNSLASNDVLAAHAGHALYREEILKTGAELYELRPDSNVIKKTWRGESRAGLHTKALVFDQESIFVGSYNLDPRSANINTEAGIYVESQELATQLLEYMKVGKQPDNAYQLFLDEQGDLVWTSLEDGVEVHHHVDPHSSWGQRLLARFFGMLPIESQL
ncbi:MAG: phospholipase D family protein [Pseudomonadota bacterium]